MGVGGAVSGVGGGGEGVGGDGFDNVIDSRLLGEGGVGDGGALGGEGGVGGGEGGGSSVSTLE